MIEIKNLTKTYKLNKKQMKESRTTNPIKTAVNDLMLTARKGEIYGLLGPNGAGKTTTLRCISTIIRPTKGEIYVGRVKNREGKRICLNLPDGAKFLDSREIYYVEIQNRMLHYHTKAGVFTIRGALKDVQEELEDWHFVKCNQCYLVNLKYVSEIRKNIAVVGGDELEISRRNRPAFLSAVVDFLGG